MQKNGLKIKKIQKHKQKSFFKLLKPRQIAFIDNYANDENDSHINIPLYFFFYFEIQLCKIRRNSDL